LPIYIQIIQIGLWEINFIALLAGKTKIWVFFGTFVNNFKKCIFFVNRGVRMRKCEGLAAQMAVIWFTDHFFYSYWPQKSFSLTTFLLNPNSSNINANGVCFETFLLLKKIAQLFRFFASFK
jgi:hypothetical protein